MTMTEVFFYVVLPLSFVVAGWIAVRLNERGNRNKHLHPGE